MPLLPTLVSPEELRGALGDERVRVFDATVILRRAVDGGPYTVHSGRAGYAQRTSPGPGSLTSPASCPIRRPGLRSRCRPAAQFAAAAGRVGIGDGTHVVAYAQDTPMWATRLWWLLRYFGHDDVSVLDGGLVAWTATGGPVEAGERHVPGRVVHRPDQPGAAGQPAVDVREITENGGACLVNALSPEAFRGEGPGSYSRPGRIPGSVNVPSSNLIDPATNRFRPPAELAAALTDGGSATTSRSWPTAGAASPRRPTCSRSG